MTALDDRLSQAIGDLRGDLDRVTPPPFKPKRSAAPALLALLLILGIGVTSLALRSGTDESGSIGVATRPADEDQPNDVAGTEEPVPAEEPTATEAVVVQSGPRSGQLSSAQAGEFYLPVSDAAWNRDETMLLLYRTGEASPGHVVLDTATGETIAELPFTPPDIEQVYWHPQIADAVLYADGAAVVQYDVATGDSSEVRRFDDCDRVDSGRIPVPPSTSGTLSLLCHNETETTQISYDLTTGLEGRAASDSDSAAFPSPSGEYLVRGNPDGSASVLDDALVETGTRFDLDNNLFAFVTDAASREWIVATLFDGSFIGTAVLMPLDGNEPPSVLVGPDRGDEYPPSGTLIAGSGSRLAFAIAGPHNGSLAGSLTYLDLGFSFDNPTRASAPHNSAGNHDYWSKPFLSLSPSGRYVAWSSDQGGDRVDTFITDFGGPTG